MSEINKGRRKMLIKRVLIRGRKDTFFDLDLPMKYVLAHAPAAVFINNMPIKEDKELCRK